jgi:nitrite reductase/ring-hydroxylating ferredoxin subunit
MAQPARVICASGDLAEGGTGVRFERAARHGTEPAFVVRFDGQARAFVNRCAHVPMELDWQPGVFFDADGLYLVCATHGAMYDPATGACAGGPCRGQGLTPIPVREENGHILLED